MIVIAFMGFFGAMKFLDLPRFEDALLTWSLVPKSLVPFLAVIVPAAELASCGLWFVGKRLSAVLLAGGLLGCFTAALITENLVGGPSDCGCFGLVAEYMRAAESLPVAIARNVAFVLALAPYTMQRWRDEQKGRQLASAS